MGSWSFVDLATKANELGITEATLRARIMSGDEICFIHAARFMAWAVGDKWLPAHDNERFPMVQWIDHGSEFRDETGFRPRHPGPPNRTPWYHVSGWVAIPDDMAADVLTRGQAELDFAHVGVLDCNLDLACELVLHVQAHTEWVTADIGVYERGGFEREIPAVVGAHDIYVRAAANNANKALSPRKEQSYLGIIAAMRALLRDKDGGGFPSDAKIIELLVDRHRTVGGISKRNLESVFADATRTAGDLLPPK